MRTARALGSLAAAVLYPIGGYIADKAGRSRLVGVSTLLSTSSFVVFAFAKSWEMIAIAYARAFIPMTIGNLIGGYIYEYNPAYPWFIQVVALMMALGMTYLIVKEPEKAES
jgi:predicted MFS family arabinose efflux permease